MGFNILATERAAAIGLNSTVLHNFGTFVLQNLHIGTTLNFRNNLHIAIMQ